MIKILHLIPTLNFGGAEMMLFKLSKHIDKKKFKTLIVCLKDLGHLEKKFQKENIDIINLNLDSRLFIFFIIPKLKKIIYEFKPDVIMSWLQLSYFLGIFIKVIFPNIKLIWNIRYSKLTLQNIGIKNVLISRLLGLFSFIPDTIVYNSEIGLSEHKKIGYKTKNNIIIPNGFDTKLFKPDENKRQKIRKQFKIKVSDFVIGFISKDQLIKGIDIFLTATEQMCSRYSNIKFIMIGKDFTKQNKKLENFININNLQERFYLLGDISKINNYITTFDILTLTSRSEGFPNVIGESMSCGIPCVSTDVGDCKKIIGQTGLIVKQNQNDIVNAWDKLYSLPSNDFSEIKRNARSRILKNYQITKVVSQYEYIISDYK